jgi:hypothetical protein
MHNPVPSTIAQVLFEPSTTLNYARIVAEMEAVLTRLKPEGLRTNWDCDDLVFFDLSETRIGLGYTEFQASAIASCLTVSVGPRHAAQVTMDAGFDVLCSRIVERLQTRYQPLAVVWNQTGEEISADLFDRMTDALPALDEALPPVHRLEDPLWGAAAAKADAAQMRAQAEDAVLAATPPSPFTVQDRMPLTPVHLRHAVPHAANDFSPAVLRHAPDLSRTRAALCQDDEPGQKMSIQMRLAVHCLNATLIIVWMPLGAAVMTYSLMKGEDLRLSGRIMALTGTALAFALTPFYQSLAAAVTGAVAGV